MNTANYKKENQGNLAKCFKRIGIFEQVFTI